MKIVDEITLEQLNKYIELGEFEIYVQPQYSISKNQIVGAEALVRWKHSDTYISPSEFIPVLEEKNLISQLDYYIWECVFQLQADKQKEGMELIPFSVNVSRKDFEHIDVYQAFTELSKKYDVLPSYIHIGIIESVFSGDQKTLFEAVRKLKQSGFHILIDDFGSGSSSLNILKDVEADVAKLDMQFFDFNEENSLRARGIIGAVMNMAQSFGMETIVEGVENSEQLDILKELGCDIIQGYYFYRPMSVADFNQLMYRLSGVVLMVEADDVNYGKECLEEGRKLVENGEYESALRLVKRALEEVDCNKDAELYCDIQNIVGIAYGSLGNEMMAVEHFLAGLSVSKKINYIIATIKFYNNIGTEYQKLKDHEHAIQYFELSLNVLEKADNIAKEKYEYIAFITNKNLCNEYYELGKYEEAEFFLEKTRAFTEYMVNANNRLGFMILQCRLYMQTGREHYVRDEFPKLVELAIDNKDKSDFWSDMEALCNLALSLGEFHAVKTITDCMERQVNMLSDDCSKLDFKVRIQELLLASYEGIGDEERLLETELEYIRLCRMQYREVQKDRAEAIDYKVRLTTQYEENILYKKQVDIDQLTGVGTRYKLEKDYKMLLGMCREKDCNIGVGIIDVDNFKQVNDTYGHLKGDNYLKVVSETVKKIMTGIGEVYRYGGDEFVVLLTDADKAAVQRAAQKIQEAIESERLENRAAKNGILTVSQGYIIMDSKQNNDIRQALSLADQQLYMVKNNGKQGYMYENGKT